MKKFKHLNKACSFCPVIRVNPNTSILYTSEIQPQKSEIDNSLNFIKKAVRNYFSDRFFDATTLYPTRLKTQSLRLYC
ncbi:MAG: hypothetical protein ACOVQ4_01175 [Flectobacillus sp.]|uniref:hypothetical protein n=1 Tax=Flectobacillus sp. TaxID=50419 RepID=UPI003B9996C2